MKNLLVLLLLTLGVNNVYSQTIEERIEFSHELNEKLEGLTTSFSCYTSGEGNLTLTFECKEFENFENEMIFMEALGEEFRRKVFDKYGFEEIELKSGENSNTWKKTEFRSYVMNGDK